MSEELKAKMEFFLSVGVVPCLLRYGDSIWKKRFFKYELIPLPGGNEYGDDARLEQPKFKSKCGTIVTQSRDGVVTTGIGFVAANLTLADSNINLVEELARIFKIDSEIMGLVFVTPKNDIVQWVGREDVHSL